MSIGNILAWHQGILWLLYHKTQWSSRHFCIAKFHYSWVTYC